MGTLDKKIYVADTPDPLWNSHMTALGGISFAIGYLSASDGKNWTADEIAKVVEHLREVRDEMINCHRQQNDLDAEVQRGMVPRSDWEDDTDG